MKTPSKGFVVALLLIGAVCVAFEIWARGSTGDSPSHTRAGRTRIDLKGIADAVRNFQMELNSEPPVPATQFFAALRGANPRWIAFFATPRDIDLQSGIPRDAWRTPYQVFLGGNGWLIRSAGPNRVFDDLGYKHSDDITVFIPAMAKDQAAEAGNDEPATTPESKRRPDSQ